MPNRGEVTVGLAEELAKLAVCRAATPQEFFGFASAFLRKVSDQVESPIILGVFTTSGKMVLPLWAAPEAMIDGARRHVGFRKRHEADDKRLNNLITLMLLQKYRLGSTSDVVEIAGQDSSTKWLFPFLCRTWQGRLVHAKRNSGPRELGTLTPEAQSEGLGQCLRRNEYSCTPLELSTGAVVQVTKERQNLTAYTPWFGDIDLDFDPLKECIVAASLHPRQANPASDTFSIFMFPVLSDTAFRPKPPDRDLLAKRIIPILPYLTTACAFIAHELRMQVTSGNPRYASRYFEIVLGRAVFDLLGAIDRSQIQKESMLGRLIRQAATSLFDGRTHPVAAWRLARELELKEEYEAASRAFHDFGLQASPRPWGQPAGDEKTKRQRISTGLRPQESRETKIVAMGSPRGGVGKTFLTYNLARRMAERTLAGRKQRVLLIELDAANPTLYFWDSQYRHKIHDFPNFEELVRTGMDQAAVVRAEAVIIGPGGKISDELKQRTCTLEKAGIDVLGAIPGVPNVAEWLAYDAAHQEDKKQIDALFRALKAEKPYDWVLIDTAAGFRDLSNAVLSCADVDLILACSLPTKPALLSTLVGLEVLRRKSVATKCLLVLNQCREMDLELFKDKASIEDFVWYWINNGGSESINSPEGVGDIPGKKLIDQVVRLATSCTVQWDPIAARVETDRDWIDIMASDFGVKHLMEAIGHELGINFDESNVSELVEEEARR